MKCIKLHWEQSIDLNTLTLRKCEIVVETWVLKAWGVGSMGVGSMECWKHPSSYDSVSVAAENVVGMGAARTCTTQPISKLTTSGL